MFRNFIVTTVLVSASFASASLALAECELDRNFTVQQSDGAVVNLSGISQNGSSFSGSAKHLGYAGSVRGKLSDNGRFKFTIKWNHGAKGIYTAFVDDNGNVQDGRTYDANLPKNWATWTMPDVECF
jgi:hypothetical protein